MYGLIHISGQTGDLFVDICVRIANLGLTIAGFLWLVVGIEIRKQGCVTFFGFHPWEGFESYEWRPRGSDLLDLRLNLRNSLVPLLQRIDIFKKEKVDQVLRQYLPEGEHSYRFSEEELLRFSGLRKNQLKRLLVFCGAFFFPLGVVLLVLSGALWWLQGQLDNDLDAMLIVGLASAFCGGAALLFSRSE
jgi:hypothetical protein